MLVEPDLGEGQILVVDENQVGPSLSDQLWHVGPLARDIELDPPAAAENAVAMVVKADCDAMGPQRGMAFLRLLQHGELSKRGRRRRGVEGPQRIHARCLQPGLGPVSKRPSRGLL